MKAIIVALSKGGVIGCKGRMPWHISEDLKYFRRTTMGGSVIMGRKTFESFEGVLGGRKNVVITRQANYAVPQGVVAVGSVEEAFRECESDDRVFVIGGGEVYRECMGMVERLYVTEVEGEYQGDTTFDEIDQSRWRELSRETHSGYSFVVYGLR